MPPAPVAAACVLDPPISAFCMRTQTAPAPGSDLATHYAPIADELRAAEALFDDELVSTVDFVNGLCTHVRGYRGKMLRPALLLLAAKASGVLDRRHVVLAAVVEMVHMATLVHDDVLDDAEQRRRRPTVKSLSGNSAAVLLGDYLISHAFHLCSSLADSFASRRIAAATNEVCEGELLQNLHCGNVELTAEEYFEIIRRKTGALTRVSSELGAHYAGAEPRVVSAMACFGASAGIAFQIVDDVLDLVGDERLMGKTLGLDAALGKLTLPVIHCLTSADAATARTVRQVCGGDLSRELLPGLLDQSGSIDYAMMIAARHVSQAIEALNSLPASDACHSLRALAGFILQRQL